MQRGEAARRGEIESVPNKLLQFTHSVNSFLIYHPLCAHTDSKFDPCKEASVYKPRALSL